MWCLLLHCCWLYCHFQSGTQNSTHFPSIQFLWPPQCYWFLSTRRILPMGTAKTRTYMPNESMNSDKKLTSSLFLSYNSSRQPVLNSNETDFRSKSRIDSVYCRDRTNYRLISKSMDLTLVINDIKVSADFQHWLIVCSSLKWRRPLRLKRYI